MRTSNLFLALMALLLAAPLMGNPGCGDDDDSAVEPAPANVAAAVTAALDTADLGIDLIEAGATLNHEPQFNPCMIADGNHAGIAIARSNVAAIEAEAANPDGKLHLDGGAVDFSRCMDMAGKPDPWPPTEPNPEAEAMVKSAVPLGVGIIKQIVEPKIPAEGEECIKGRVALAMMDAIGELVTTTVIDAVNGKAVTTIPAFDVDYSGCGLDFTEADAEPITDKPEAVTAGPAPKATP